MQIMFRDCAKMMESINSGNECESYFEGQGNGNVKWIIEEKLIKLEGGKTK